MIKAVKGNVFILVFQLSTEGSRCMLILWEQRTCSSYMHLSCSKDFLLSISLAQKNTVEHQSKNMIKTSETLILAP